MGPEMRAGCSRRRARPVIGRLAVIMDKGIWIALFIVLAVALYTLVKVIHFARLSREQWKNVDKSKLQEWQDDDDW